MIEEICRECGCESHCGKECNECMKCKDCTCKKCFKPFGK